MSISYFKYAVVALCAVLTGRGGVAGAQGIATGVYGRITLAYDTAKQNISGYIDIAPKGDDEYKPCNLLFVGKYKGSAQTEVQFYHNFTDTISLGSAVLSMNDDETIELKCSRKPEPCNKPVGINLDTVYKRTIKGDFSVIAVVRKDKQFLYEQPDFEAKLKSYVEKGDPVAVLKNKHNWILIKTLRNQNNYKWIPKNCLY